QIFADLPKRPPGQAVTLQCPLVQHRSVATGHRALDPYRPDLAVSMAKQPSARLVVALVTERQAVVAGQIVGCAGRTMQCEVGGRRDNDTTIVGQSQANNAGIVEVSDTNGAVITLFDQVDEAVCQVERYGNFRIVAQKLRQ